MIVSVGPRNLNSGNTSTSSRGHSHTAHSEKEKNGEGLKVEVASLQLFSSDLLYRKILQKNSSYWTVVHYPLVPKRLLTLIWACDLWNFCRIHSYLWWSINLIYNTWQAERWRKNWVQEVEVGIANDNIILLQPVHLSLQGFYIKILIL